MPPQPDHPVPTHSPPASSGVTRQSSRSSLAAPSGLSTSDSYATTYAKATSVIKNFQADLGTNTVRFPINPYTVNGSFWSSYTGAIDAATAQGYTITLLPVVQPTQDLMRGAFTQLDELAVDAVIAIVEVHLLDAATVTLPPRAEVVVVDSDAGDRYSVVDTDQAEGARQAVRHLLDLGHRTVWHVAGPAESFAAEHRTRTWREELERAGCPVPELLRGDWSAESGYHAAQRLLGEPDCTAVFAANDEMALGVLRALHEDGRRVPQDVSVVGFDDISPSACFVPPLTTVHQDFAEVGRRCVDQALRQIRGEPVAHGTSLVPTHLVVRESTAPPPSR